jgi:hypothetical protein
MKLRFKEVEKFNIQALFNKRIDITTANSPGVRS